MVYNYTAQAPQTTNLIEGILYLGLELEFKYISDDQELALQELGIFCEDSSCGVELKTAPVEPEVQKALLRKHATTLAELEVDSSCGMHVHLSQSALSRNQQYTLETVILGLTEIQQIALAGRVGNTYCEYERYTGHTRYVAINYPAHHPTVEVRIFAGTNDVDVVIARIEWLLNVISNPIEAPEEWEEPKQISPSSTYNSGDYDGDDGDWESDPIPLCAYSEEDYFSEHVTYINDTYFFVMEVNFSQLSPLAENEARALGWSNAVSLRSRHGNLRRNAWLHE